MKEVIQATQLTNLEVGVELKTHFLLNIKGQLIGNGYPEIDS